MRLLSSLAVLLFSLPSFAAAEGDYAGAWVATLCPAKEQPSSGKCSNFVLELLQQENRVCGAHVFTTAGAAEMDEGPAPSVVGEVAGETATGVAVSGRGTPPVRLQVELTLMDGALHWKRLDNPPGDYLLPRKAKLTRAKGKSLFAPFFVQELQSMCSLHFNAARQQEPPRPEPAR
jgi:hypothetical protein